MADCMMFPNDWHDFIKDYSFIDSEQVYTNGSELIQVFRVTQLIEHLLIEQEAVKPFIQISEHTGRRWLACGACEYSIASEKESESWDEINFCPMCGKPIDWGGR